MRNGIIHGLGYLLIGGAFAAMMVFVVLNLLVGCETWADPACITPKEFLGMFLGG